MDSKLISLFVGLDRATPIPNDIIKEIIDKAKVVRSVEIRYWPMFSTCFEAQKLRAAKLEVCWKCARVDCTTPVWCVRPRNVENIMGSRYHKLKWIMEGGHYLRTTHPMQIPTMLMWHFNNELSIRNITVQVQVPWP